MDKKIELNITECETIIFNMENKTIPIFKKFIKENDIGLPILEHRITIHKYDNTWTFEEFYGFKGLLSHKFYNSYSVPFDKLPEKDIRDFLVGKIIETTKDYRWNEVLEEYLSERQNLKTLDKVKKCCDTCECNIGKVCTGSGERLDNGEDIYGMPIEESKKMFPDGCDC